MMTKKAHYQAPTKTTARQLKFVQKQENQARQLLDIQTIPQLCKFLELSLDELKKIVEFPEYITFTISKKNGGCRTINAPGEKLKRIQRKINTHLQSLYFLTKSPHSHGFVIQNKISERKPNIYLNALPHVGNKFLLNVDIKDFFGSISAARIYDLFHSSPFYFNRKISETLALICTLQKCLPQGAPTSPVLSNFICQNLDKDLQIWAKANSFVYTRYADDLSFSADLPFSTKHSQEIETILGSFGFKQNSRKLRMTSSKKKMQVTGLVVNKKINIDRKYIKKVRAMLHDLLSNGLDCATKNHFRCHATDETSILKRQFIWRLQGSLAFIGQIRGAKDPIYTKYQQQLHSFLSAQ